MINMPIIDYRDKELQNLDFDFAEWGSKDESLHLSHDKKVLVYRENNKYDITILE